MTLNEIILNNPKYTDIEDALLNGADVNYRDPDGDTPLHLILLDNNDNLIIDVCSLLLKAGADVNAQNNDGDTPLNIALIVGLDIEIINVMIKFGANINIQNNNNETYVVLAHEYASKEIIEMLEYPCIINLENNEEIISIIGNTL